MLWYRPVSLVLIQALSKRHFQANQNQAVENFTIQGPHGPQNVIEKYIAGQTRYELTRSKYGQRNVSTVTSSINKNVRFLNDSGSRPFTLLTTVDEEKKNHLKAELAHLNQEYNSVQEQLKEKEGLEAQLRVEFDSLNAEKVSRS